MSVWRHLIAGIPAYLVFLGLTVLALLFLPLSSFFTLIRMPDMLADIVTNIAILGQVTFDFKQWLPLAKPVVTSWSLSIELFSYLLLALYFARSSSRLWTFAVIGAVAMGISTWHCAASVEPAAYGPYCAQNRYGVLQAGFIPFAMGGLFYFHQRALSFWITANLRVLIALLIAGHAAMFLGNALTATIGPYLGIGVIFSCCRFGRQRSRAARTTFSAGPPITFSSVTCPLPPFW